MPVSARYNWTIDDLLTGRRITMRLNRRLLYFRIAVVIAFLVFAWQAHQSGNGLQPIFLGGAIAIPLLVLLRRFISEWTLRRQFPKRPDAGAEVGWDISEDGILATSPNTRTELKWTAFQRVIATPKGIIFMPNRQIFHFLPARSFAPPEEMETVATMASRLVPDFKRLK